LLKNELLFQAHGHISSYIAVRFIMLSWTFNFCHAHESLMMMTKKKGRAKSHVSNIFFTP
jgi:hypothetical protein